MDVDGEAIQLHRIKGKYLAGYIRVSLEEQRESGISIPDQIARISEYAIRNRLAFRIFSDAGVSDPHINVGGLRLAVVPNRYLRR